MSQCKKKNQDHKISSHFHNTKYNLFWYDPDISSLDSLWQGKKKAYCSLYKPDGFLQSVEFPFFLFIITFYQFNLFLAE